MTPTASEELAFIEDLPCVGGVCVVRAHNILYSSLPFPDKTVERLVKTVVQSVPRIRVSGQAANRFAVGIGEDHLYIFAEATRLIIVHYDQRDSLAEIETTLGIVYEDRKPAPDPKRPLSKPVPEALDTKPARSTSNRIRVASGDTTSTANTMELHNGLPGGFAGAIVSGSHPGSDPSGMEMIAVGRTRPKTASLPLLNTSGILEKPSTKTAKLAQIVQEQPRTMAPAVAVVPSRATPPASLIPVKPTVAATAQPAAVATPLVPPPAPDTTQRPARSTPAIVPTRTAAPPSGATQQAHPPRTISIPKSPLEKAAERVTDPSIIHHLLTKVVDDAVAQRLISQAEREVRTSSAGRQQGREHLIGLWNRVCAQVPDSAKREILDREFAEVLERGGA